MKSVFTSLFMYLAVMFLWFYFYLPFMFIKNVKRSQKNNKKRLPLNTARYIKGEDIGGREKETFYCPACDEYITIHYGTRTARTAYVHKKFPRVRNNILHLAGKQYGELKCKKNWGYKVLFIVSCTKYISKMKYEQKFGKVKY